jgi:hypothetical protein
MQTNYFNGCNSPEELTKNELLLIDAILNRVNNVMKFDDTINMYIDNGDFILSLHKKEKEMLINALQKISKKL